jgi:chromosome segregation ATPase
MQLKITMSQPKERHNSARRIAESAEVMVAMSVFRGELALLEGQLRRTVEREADIVQLGVRALLAGEVPALRDSLKKASYECAAARAGEGGDVGTAIAEAAAKAAITSEMASDDQVLAARREAEEARREAELLQAQLRELREAAAARIEADATVGQAAEQAAAARREVDAARREASEAAAQAEALHRLVQEHRSEAQAERREVERLRKRKMDLTATIRRQADQLSQASMQLQSTVQELSATKSERAAAQQLKQQPPRKEKK